jgi:hypothetical protein
MCPSLAPTGSQPCKGATPRYHHPHDSGDFHHTGFKLATGGSVRFLIVIDLPAIVTALSTCTMAKLDTKSAAVVIQ